MNQDVAARNSFPQNVRLQPLAGYLDTRSFPQIADQPLHLVRLDPENHQLRLRRQGR